MEDSNAPAQSQEKINPITRWITRHPIAATIGFVGGIASIVGIPMSYYFWKVEPRRRELTYAVQPVRSVLVHGAQNTNMTVLYKGHQITNDINVAQVLIANAGGVPIESGDILSPLSLVISNGAILELSPRVEAKAGTDLVLEYKPDSDRVALRWKILEKDDNPIIQILYAGPGDARISLEGRVREQPHIKEVQWPNPTLVSSIRSVLKNAVEFTVFIWVGVVWIFIGIIGRRVDKERIHYFWVALGIIGVSGATGLMLYQLYRALSHYLF
jgi:hypothetical protein